MKTTIEKRERKGPINPFVDWGFKYVFGREESKDLLMGFLNLLLKSDVPIKDIAYLNPEVIADQPSMRRCVFDVLCTDEKGDKYLIEMQKASDSDIRQRLIYYVCRLVDQMGRSNKNWEYSRIKRVYGICLMDFTYEKAPKLRHDIMLLDTKDGKVFSDLLNIITLQIPCINADNLEDCRESYEKMLYLLRTISKKMKTTEELLAEVESTNLPESMKVIFRRVINTVEENLTEDQWRDYELDLDKYQRTMSEFRTARAEGREEGFAEGRAEGRAEGLAEGLAEGRRLMAEAMLKNGVAIEIVSRCSGISESELQSL